MLEFRSHWSLFPRDQLTIFQRWFRSWLGVVQVPSHYMNQWWLVCWRIYFVDYFIPLDIYINISSITVYISWFPCYWVCIWFWGFRLWFHICRCEFNSEQCHILPEWKFWWLVVVWDNKQSIKTSLAAMIGSILFKLPTLLHLRSDVDFANDFPNKLYWCKNVTREIMFKMF